MLSITGSRRHSLCLSCRTDFFGKKAWEKVWQNQLEEAEPYKHRTNSLNLVTAAGRGCSLCACILAEVPKSCANEDIEIILEYILGSLVRPEKLNILRFDITLLSSRIMLSPIILGVSAKPGNVASQIFRAPFRQKGKIQNFEPQRIRSWIRECETLHKECSKNHIGRFPTRLVDVINGGVKAVRLHVVDTIGCQKYAALSYCWGSSHPFTTTKASIQQHLQHIEVAGMPQTFQDAVHVTRELGLKYLWIDALCIVQNCPNDMIEELSRMRLYYENASVVIAASSAKDVSQGFLQFRQLKKGFNPSISASDKEGLTTTEVSFYDVGGREDNILLDLKPQFYVPLDEPLNQRAWTFQERLLCPRVLGFPSSGGCFLQCEKEERHDDSVNYGGSNGMERMYPNNSWATTLQGCDLNDPHEAWMMHAREYSRRGLSKSEDKYNAISGIAEAYHVRYQTSLGDYLVGHWRNQLNTSLLWYSHGLEQVPAPAIARPPSWSWLSVDGAITFLSPVILQQNRIERAEILFAGLEIAFEKLPFGPVRLGCLSIRGSISKVQWVPDNRFPYSPSLEFENGTRMEGTRTFADTHENFPKRNTAVFALPICSAGAIAQLYGLLLRRVASNYDGLYYRVGQFHRAPLELLDACSRSVTVAII